LPLVVEACSLPYSLWGVVLVGDLEELVEALRGRLPSRGGPRSRVVEAILVLLLSRPMRSSEIAGVLGFSSRYVSSYLSYWRTRGLVDYDSGYWFLTPKGEAIAREVYERETRRGSDEYTILAQKILSSGVSQAMKSKGGGAGRGEASELLPFIAELKGKGGNKLQERVSAGACLLNALKGSLREEELDVLMTLVAHYARWGTTYMYLDQLQERMNADYTWLVKVLRELQSKGLIYIYTDPRLGVRVGFSRNIKQQLDKCINTNTTTEE